jgi:hypothetical protein
MCRICTLVDKLRITGCGMGNHEWDAGVENCASSYEPLTFVFETVVRVPRLPSADLGVLN